MKGKRQKAILELIAERELENQAQLMDALQEQGFACTQATVSRDIKELHLVKELSATGSYCYVTSHNRGKAELEARLRTIFRECVVSFEAAQNIVVLKTMPGLASAAASALDGMEVPDMAGTLAGDDTAILIMRSNGAAEVFSQELHRMLK